MRSKFTRDTAPHLTAREHRYLWLMANGFTPKQAQEILNTVSTPALSTRIRRKIGARTMEQAVFLACQLDLLGPFEDCGTLKGYQGHVGRAEDPCRACRRKYSELTDRSGRAPLRPDRLTLPELRLLRSYAAGRNFRRTVEQWECSPRVLDDVRSSLYRKLDVAHLPVQSRVTAALDEGRRRGYLPPLDILPSRPDARRWGTTALTALEVQTLTACGDSTPLSAAAELLGIPSTSVSSRLTRIYRKLGVYDSHPHGERREAALKEARNRGYAV